MGKNLERNVLDKLTPIIFIGESLWEKIHYLVKKTTSEVSFLCKYEYIPKGNGTRSQYWLVEDSLIFPKQEGSAGNTRICPKFMQEWLSDESKHHKDAVLKGSLPSVGFCHIHSHGTGGVFFSPTDEQLYAENANLAPLLSIVTNHKGDLIARVDVLVPSIPGAKNANDCLHVALDAEIYVCGNDMEDDLVKSLDKTFDDNFSQIKYASSKTNAKVWNHRTRSWDDKDDGDGYGTTYTYGSQPSLKTSGPLVYVTKNIRKDDEGKHLMVGSANFGSNNLKIDALAINGCKDMEQALQMIKGRMGAKGFTQPYRKGIAPKGYKKLIPLEQVFFQNPAQKIKVYGKTKTASVTWVDGIGELPSLGLDESIPKHLLHLIASLFWADSAWAAGIPDMALYLDKDDKWYWNGVANSFNKYAKGVLKEYGWFNN